MEASFDPDGGRLNLNCVPSSWRYNVSMTSGDPKSRPLPPKSAASSASKGGPPGPPKFASAAPVAPPSGTPKSVPASPPGPPRSAFENLLCNPVFDKAVAIGLVAYSVKNLVGWVGQAARFDLMLALLQVPIHNFFLLTRRTPQQFTLKPLDWTVGLAAANWGLVWVLLPEIPRDALVPQLMYRGMMLGGTALGVWARVSLGRSFGILPARREIVVDGAYRYVRHPIFTAAFLTNFGYLMGHYSLIGLLVFVSGQALTYVKAGIEENFLSQDPAYAAYRQQVKWRFLPGFY